MAPVRSLVLLAFEFLLQAGCCLHLLRLLHLQSQCRHFLLVMPPCLGARLCGGVFLRMVGKDRG
jgi:hypothetical protein